MGKVKIMIKTSHKTLVSYVCACLVLFTACQSAETISPLPSSRIVLAAVDKAAPDRPCIEPTIHWAPFLKLNDIRYVGYRKGPAIDKSMLGDEVAQVDFMVNCHANIGYKIQNGDAAFMPIGTPIYAIKGVDLALQLAAVQEGRLTLFEADTNSPTQ